MALQKMNAYIIYDVVIGIEATDAIQPVLTVGRTTDPVYTDSSQGPRTIE